MRGESLQSRTQRLSEAIPVIEGVAKDLGLDPFPTHFRLGDAERIYELAGYYIPGRFSHWTHGRDTEIMKTRYDYGLSRIYELVINSNPAEAFLLEGNSWLANVVVAAHVFGHTDFFKNNPAFDSSNRDIVPAAAATATRFSGYEFEHGIDTVEDVIDAVKMIDTHIDHPKHQTKPPRDEYLYINRKKFEDDQEMENRKGQSGEFDDLFNMTSIRAERRKIKAPLPAIEETDLLWFIGNFSRVLDDWEKDIVFGIRDESYYFYPQAKTGIMNEGWASFWHNKIIHEMSRQGLLTDEDIVDFSRMNAGVLEPNPQGINPYTLGLGIWSDIERRSLKLPHPDKKIIKNWRGDETNQDLDFDGFFVRKSLDSDAAFLREFLTDYLIDDLDLYKYGPEGSDQIIQETGKTDPVKVRETLINLYDQPQLKIAVGGLDFNGKGELYIRHEFDGRSLKRDWTEQTIQGIYRLWGAPVYLETVLGGKKTLLTASDGKTVTSKEI